MGWVWFGYMVGFVLVRNLFGYWLGLGWFSLALVSDWFGFGFGFGLVEFGLVRVDWVWLGLGLSWG